MREYVDPHPDKKGSDQVFEPCGRCGGSGIYQGPTNARWDNGTRQGERPYCFWCNGYGHRPVKVSSVRARVRREVKAANEAAERTARYEAALVGWKAAGYEALHNEGSALAAEGRMGDPLVRALVNALEALHRPLSAGEAEAEAVRAAMVALQEREAAKVPVEEGRREVAGVVKSMKVVHSQFGSTWKMLVEQADGTRVWGSVPAAIDPEVGDEVKFVATVQRSDDDIAFGFFSRPSKAEVVEAATEAVSA